MYTALYMASSTRTQVYFTASQRRRLDVIAERRKVRMAEVVREAVDAYLGGMEAEEEAAVLAETFGALPDLTVPSRDEWDRARPRRH